MLDYKLFKLLQLLTSKELLDIEKHLAASFFNPTEDVLKLFVQACKFYPNFDSPKLTKERLFAKLYGKTPYNDGKMRKLMTHLMQAIEKYLIQKELWESKELQTRLLAKSLAGRDNFPLFQATILTRLKTLDEQVERGRDYFRESHELSQLLYHHPGSGILKNKDDYQSRFILDFERYFTLVTLQNETNNVVRNRLILQKDTSSYLEASMQVSKLPAFVSSKAIRFFAHLVDLLKGQIAEDLDQLRNTAFEALRYLSSFEQDFAIGLLRAYAIPFSNQGSVPHKQFVLELYKLELEQGFFANTIPSGAFMNIASVAISLGELDWVKYFLSKFSQYIPQNEREITVNYCQGLVHYHKGLQSKQVNDFYNALQSMSRIPIRTGPNFELRVRTSLLRIHFELFERGKEDLDEFMNQVRSFERHLNTSSDYAAPIRDSYIHFLRWCRILARLVANPDLEKALMLDFVEKLTQESSDIAVKPWLLEKAKELADLD